MPHTPTPGFTPGSKLTILLVDDNDAVNYLTRYMLHAEAVQAEVEELHNGRKALEYIARYGMPDIILLDICMPVMDGYEFLLALKKLNPDRSKTRIYILSTSIIEWEQQKFEHTGMVSGFFEKPLNREAILSILSDIRK